MALAVHSDLNWMEFVEWFKRYHVYKLHPKGHDTVFRNGHYEFINPKIMCPNDFANNCPSLMGFK